MNEKDFPRFEFPPEPMKWFYKQAFIQEASARSTEREFSFTERDDLPGDRYGNYAILSGSSVKYFDAIDDAILGAVRAMAHEAAGLADKLGIVGNVPVEKVFVKRVIGKYKNYRLGDVIVGYVMRAERR